MGFEIDVDEPVPAAVLARLHDFVGCSALHAADGHVVVAVEDQSALVGVVARLTDLGVGIHRVRPAEP